MRTAAIQLSIDDAESKESRIERAGSFIDRAAERADLVLLPEIWATGYFSFERYAAEAESLNGPLAQFLSAKAKQHGVWLFAGSFVEADGPSLYNTSLLFDREGRLVGSYRKTHLFRYGSREGELLSGGDGAGVIETEFGKLGMTTCYDLRFPEIYRQQVDRGAEVLLVTAAWPIQRLEHWKLLNAVRAMENQCFLISCNGSGTTQGVTLGGHSSVVDPWGVTIASGGERQTIVRAELDLSEISRVREAFPLLKHRVLT